jgi:hypothetical protein
MPTAPAVETGDAASRREQIAGLLMTARQAGELVDEDECIARLEEATALAIGTAEGR